MKNIKEKNRNEGDQVVNKRLDLKNEKLNIHFDQQEDVR